MVPPSKRATISRAPQAANPKPDWVQSVIAKAFLSLALTVVWKLSYATKGRLLPIACEKCGLELEFGYCRFRARRAGSGGPSHGRKPTVKLLKLEGGQCRRCRLLGGCGHDCQPSTDGCFRRCPTTPLLTAPGRQRVGVNWQYAISALIHGFRSASYWFGGICSTGAASGGRVCDQDA